jgi:hypothetical protein
MPVGVWVRLPLPECPEFVGFTYVDPQAGFSAQAQVPPGAGEEQGRLLIVRLPIGVPWEVLPEAEVIRLGLPAVPPQIPMFYGPQPRPGTLWGGWRQHPKLEGRFHPESRDDLQVVVHDGGPRLTEHRPELVWVRVTGGEGDIFTGKVLNQPHHLRTVSQGDEIRFLAPAGGEHLLMVTRKYLAERPNWTIVPCNRCGLSELFDAPSDLLRVVFPNTPAGAEMMTFSAFCGACGGVLLVKSKKYPENEAASGGPAEPPPAGRPQQGKRWWEFWK